MAYTPLGAPAQFPDVAAYIMVPTATGFDHCEFAGRNRRWFLQVLSGLESDHVQLTIAGDRVGDHGAAEAPGTEVWRAGNTWGLRTSRCSTTRTACTWRPSTTGAARLDGNSLSRLTEPSFGTPADSLRQAEAPSGLVMASVPPAHSQCGLAPP